MSTSPNYYSRLGLTKDATSEDIRLAYRRVARVIHPDVNKDLAAGEVFIQIKEAYEILSDPVKRAAYDASPDSDDDAVPLSLNIHYSRPALTRIDQPQIVYVLMELIPVIDNLGESSPPLNICLVIDRSTSMQGTRMDVVKKTAIDIVHQLRPHDILSIVAFNDRAELVLPATQSSQQDNIEASIHMLQTAGSTEMYRGLETGFLEIRKSRRRNSINHLILITDGHTYGDQDACIRLADQAASLGIGITALGIGSEWNDAFLDDLTSRTGHNSVYVAEPMDIEWLLKGKLQTLGQVSIDQVAFNAQVGQKVSLNYAFRLEPEAASLNTSETIQIGSIPQDAKLRLILEFIIDPLPTRKAKIILAHGYFNLGIPSRSAPTSVFQFNLQRPVRNTPDLEPPPDSIIKAMEQLTLYRMQEKVQFEVAAGDITNATRHLQLLATNLLSRGERDLAYAVINEIDHLQEHHSFSEAGDKRIKYGTRSLILPE